MAEIIAWTTEELEFELRDESQQIPEGIFDGLDEVIITIAQGNTLIEKALSKDEVAIHAESGTLRIHLSQQETAKLRGGIKGKPKTASTQVNLYYQTQSRNATYESSVDVLRNLHKRRMA